MADRSPTPASCVEVFAQMIADTGGIGSAATQIPKERQCAKSWPTGIIRSRLAAFIGRASSRPVSPIATRPRIFVAAGNAQVSVHITVDPINDISDKEDPADMSSFNGRQP